MTNPFLLSQMGLNRKYIGDGWPLCADLPTRHFLKKGATFRLLGVSPTPELHEDPPAWSTLDRPSLETGSQLYQKLCNNHSGSCDFHAKIVLDDDISSCTGIECNVDTLRVFQVEDVFYEYVRVPCVHQAFYNNATLIKTIADDRDFMCGDPRTGIASTACCNIGSNIASLNELFSWERVPFSMAQQRCGAAGTEPCTFPEISECGSGDCDESLHYWTSDNCQLRIKINLEGNVAIVHSATVVERSEIAKMVQEDTKTFFRVEWIGNSSNPFSDYDAMCSGLGCTRDAYDNLCLCDVSVTEEPVFTGKPDRDEVISQLHMGAFSLGLPPFEEDAEVKVYSSDGEYSKETVFKVVDDNGITQLRKNVKSVVSIGNGNLMFRNPVHFISLADPEVRDAHYETDAALDHYFYHQNTAPFLAIRFAQRFGISNPTPRYVKAIANAFRSGIYEHVDDDTATTTTFGSGQYGNLAATIAAVLLDREARTVLLDADPTHGSLLEPFLKVVRLMRSLEYEGDVDKPFIVFKDDLQDLLGEESHKLPSVFSFFKPEYQPAGKSILHLKCNFFVILLIALLQNIQGALRKRVWSVQKEKS